MARYPIVLAILAQLLALLFCAGLVWGLAWCGWRLSFEQALWLQGSLAAAISWRLGLAWWWWLMGLIFVPALQLSQQWGMAAWVPLLVAMLLLLVTGNSIQEQVPLYVSGKKVREALALLLAERSGKVRFVDLGCGLGSVVCALAKRFPQHQFVGVETAPLSFAWAWLRAWPLANCHIYYRSLWREDLSGYEIVYCFLSPKPMLRVWQQAQAQMQPGAWLLSNSFAVPQVPAQRCVEVEDLRGSRLLLWVPVSEDKTG